MGIRFLCHHCERRLNVKASQAGMEGQCPHCEGIILVPAESTIPSDLEKQQHRERSQQRAREVQADQAIGLHDVDEQVTMEGVPAEERSRKTRGPKFKDQTVSTYQTEADDSDDSAELFMLDKPKIPEAIGKVDPIEQAPNAIWYFRSHELGERGPLKSKAVREHFERGDIQIGCIVWRDDWNDWLPAEKVFPTLTPGVLPEPKQRKLFPFRFGKKADRVAASRLAASPMTELELRQRKHNRIFMGAISAGVCLILILLFVLFRIVANS